MAALRLGVLGGTFDPPHYGHLLLAEQAREQLELERVIWVPAGDPWRKAATVVSAGEHRVAMVSKAIEDNDAFEVDTREIERAGPSYTVDTLASLTEEFATHELIFLLGADALADLAHWHDAAQVIRLALLGATARGGHEQSASELEGFLPGLSKRIVWFQMPRMDISATDLRGRAAEGRSLRYFVPPAVEEYIVRHNLYSPA